MAFQTADNTANSATPATGARRAQGDYEKALGFLNFYLPTKGGQTRRKVGSIPLNASKPVEKQVFDALMADPAKLEAIVAKLIVEFNPQIDEASADNQLDI